MTTKNKILKFLEENRDQYISGEDLGNKLNISRTAIWKGVKNLKEDGYKIKSSTNKGYKLDENCDKVSSFGVKYNLSKDLKDIDVIYYDTIDSTNTEAKRLLYSKKLSNFTVIISDEQSAGRGRRGRNFMSPKGTGIYLSIIIFPKSNINLDSFDLITIKAAVAVVEAIKNKTGKNPTIKWVNDIFLNNKKICGILSEADSDFESRHIKSIIVGIGLNFNTNDEEFSDDLKSIAGSLSPENLLRNELAGEIINQFYKTLYKMKDDEVLKLYKDACLLINKEVEFEKNGIKYEALALDINDKGNLIVQLKDQTSMVLTSGEISVKGKC
ncbi:MAG: biotin--[acetyl-CoA-carboxylase] ligase [Peptoniphilaceae bacterium]